MMFSPEQQRMLQEQLQRRSKVAQSKASATPIAAQQGAMQPGGAGPSGQSPLRQMGMQIGKKLIGGLFGGLFNEGGKVQQQKPKKSWWEWFYGSRTGPNPNSIWAQTGRNMGGPIHGYNMGGKMPLNPHGYNEGGMAHETPIKKVMDEQKLDQQAMAFELEQQRKEEAHQQAMRIKEQQAKQAAKMKTAAATTSKTATKPKKPLAKA